MGGLFKAFGYDASVPFGWGCGVVSGSIRGGASAVFLILFAVGLQSAFTSVVHGNYVRVAASDVILPLSLLFSFVLWWREGKALPSRPLRHLAFGLCGLTAWLGVSLVVGYFRMGHLELWGLFNKLIGFIWLIGYFFAGYALFRQSFHGNIGIFIRALLICGWVVAVYSAVSCFSYAIGFSWPAEPMTRAIGLSENPNAYGCFVAVIFVIEAAFSAKEMVFSRRWHLFGMVLLAVALLLSGSRSAWLGAVGGVALLMWLKSVNLRQLAVVLALTTLCLSPLYISLPRNISDKGVSHRIVYLQEEQVFRQNSSVNHRLLLTHQALDLWSSTPVLGAGLGAFFAQQKLTNPDQPATIHTSALWLLAETGIIGLAFFCCFFLYCARALWRVRDYSDPQSAVLVTAVLAVLVVAAIASIGTELLYQRHLWFLLGLAWAVRCSYPGDVRLSEISMAQDARE